MINSDNESKNDPTSPAFTIKNASCLDNDADTDKEDNQEQIEEISR